MSSSGSQGGFANSVAGKCFSGGAGCAVSGFVTNPCDVVKIRNQQYGGEKYGSFLGTFRQIAATEGAAGFFKGVQATVLRESTYSSVRMGLYEPIKTMVAGAVGTEKHPAVKFGIKLDFAADIFFSWKCSCKKLFIYLSRSAPRILNI